MTLYYNLTHFNYTCRKFFTSEYGLQLYSDGKHCRINRFTVVLLDEVWESLHRFGFKCEFLIFSAIAPLTLYKFFLFLCQTLWSWDQEADFWIARLAGAEIQLGKVHIYKQLWLVSSQLIRHLLHTDWHLSINFWTPNNESLLGSGNHCFMRFLCQTHFSYVFLKP